jgi:beta-glucosidase
MDAGELRHVQLALQPRDLSYVNEGGDRFISPGEYVVSVGGGQPGTTAAQVESRLSIHGELKFPE